jgi:hypothetical protein
MRADILTLPLPTDSLGRLEKRLMADLALAAEEWSDCATALTKWEDEHLLDNPPENLLQRHKATAERLLRFGEQLSSAMGHPNFTDNKLKEMVAATNQLLQNKLTMWHGKMSNERRKEILQAVFNES